MYALTPLLFFLGLASAAPAVTSPQAACASGVHIIVARASNESPGEGIIGSVATQIKNQIPGSSDVAVDYPATLDDYISSESNGTVAMTKLIKSYYAQCPKGKIVLLGYSQGAQVTLDTLCGTSEQAWTQTPALSATYGKNIVAAIAMGDPSHVPKESYDVGTSTKSGVFQRESPACTAYASRIQSYCDATDFFCDNGDSVPVHKSYVKKYGSAATSFVVNKYKATQ